MIPVEEAMERRRRWRPYSTNLQAHEHDAAVLATQPTGEEPAMTISTYARRYERYTELAAGETKIGGDVGKAQAFATLALAAATMALVPTPEDITPVTPVRRSDFHTLTEDDVGKTHVRIFGRTWPVTGFIGRILPGDVGKRVYLVRGVLQVENDEQRDRRLGVQS